jgi:hypothetical protein
MSRELRLSGNTWRGRMGRVGTADRGDRTTPGGALLRSRERKAVPEMFRLVLETKDYGPA